jgi:LAT3 family solute carrier family 43 protein 3
MMSRHLGCLSEERRRWILYVFGFSCTFIIAGAVYGWPAFRQQLKDEGTTLTEKQLGAIFTVGSWSTLGGSFLTGLARDRFGTRLTVCTSFLFCTAGSLGMAISDPSNAIALGVSLFALGLGSGVQVCVAPVAGLFPNNAGSILASLSGAYNLSGLVFLALCNPSNNRLASFLGFAAFLLMWAVMSAFLMPKGDSFLVEQEEKGRLPETIEETTKTDDGKEPTEIPLSQPGSESDEENDSPKNKTPEQAFEECDGGCYKLNSNASLEDDDHLSAPSTDLESQSTQEDKPPSALEQMKSAEYILLTLWLSILLAPLQYFVGSIGFQLEEKGDDDGFYTNLFSITYAAGIVVAPVGGYMADNLGLGITQGVATLLCAFSLLMMASDLPLNAQIVAFVAYGAGRMFMFSMHFANVGKRFGYANFGTLSGVGLLTSSIVSLVQYPLIALTADGNGSTVNAVCGSVLLGLLPYCIWLDRRERAGIGGV